MKKIQSTILIASLFVSQVIKAQDGDIFDLSLEELMSINIKRTTLTDVPHMHREGEIMVSYTYMNMLMSGMKNGNDNIPTDEVLEQYLMEPTHMTMSMHMLGLMYSPNDKITLMSMIPYHYRDMEMQTRNGTTFNTKSSGIGDLKISSLFSIIKNESQILFVTTGISIPLGSTDIRDETPMSMGNEVRLAYPMQLGSGTLDPFFGITGIKITKRYGTGINVNSILRLYNNENQWRKGSELNILGWYSYILKEYLTITSQLKISSKAKYTGSDPELNPMMMPTADADLQGGTSIYGGLGVNFLPFAGKLEQFRFTLSGNIPLYQNLNGPQMSNSGTLTLSISNVF